MPTERSRRIFKRWAPTLGSLLPLLLLPPTARAELGQAQTDFGGVGLLQVPTARMAPLGEFSFTYSDVDPYTRYNFSLQPADWLEFGFRYTEIENRLYGEAIAGDRDYLDKGFDVKLRLWPENRYWPQFAVGLRDFGGTGLFSGEYLVASKRWYNLDFTLGLGWGYLGARGDMENPLEALSDRFETRASDTGNGGKVNSGDLFSGEVGLFGGVEYQTPWDPLVLQLEYDGNDYRSEPLDNTFEQDSPFNAGARYAINDGLTLSLGWERGNTLMAGATLSANLAGLSQVKQDPPPVPLKMAPETTTEDWERVNQSLQHNAGLRVQRVTRRDDELLVEVEPTKYRSLLESEVRANRILHNSVDDDVATFRYRWYARGMGLRDDVHGRESFLAATDSAAQETQYRYGLYATALTEPDHVARRGDTLYESDLQRFSWSLSPGLNQNLGGPDGYLYQLYAQLNAEYRTDANGWFSGRLAWNLLDNLEEYDYLSASELPRVRTHIGDYLEETSLGIYNLQYTRTARLGRNWYAMGYGGLLEMMYAGAGGEVLYRPFNSPLALGVDLNWVKQRDFDQQFGMRDYDTVTGHATAYIETGIEDVLAQISVGRYLAADIGTTIDLSREFASGVRVGAWATFTDAGDDYGEGSFDKGVYIALPFDAFFTRSSRSYTSVAWQPLTRDGGARLGRRYGLYSLTSERDMGRYWEESETPLD